MAITSLIFTVKCEYSNSKVITGFEHAQGPKNSATNQGPGL